MLRLLPYSRLIQWVRCFLLLPLFQCFRLALFDRLLLLFRYSPSVPFGRLFQLFRYSRLVHLPLWLRLLQLVRYFR